MAAAGLVVILLVMPALAHAWLQPIEFNQLLIEKVNLRYGVSPISSVMACVRSSYSSGWNILRNRPSRTPPDYWDTPEMFAYVFSWLPGHAVAYPTEAYYYFAFEHPQEGLVCGSIRLSDLDDGFVVFNYFKIHAEPNDRELVSCHIDDVTIRRRSPVDYVVGHRGREVRFRLLDSRFLERPPSIPTLPEEEFVTRMFDESGLAFLVYFNHATASFYYVLDEARGVADTLEPVGDKGHLRGRRTGFIFYDDPEYSRRILVGVSFACLQRNDFFDGPGDQLPFRLPIRDKLHIAYPSTKVGEGVDEHGVLRGRSEWSRFIISSYHAYSTPQDMLDYNQVVLNTEWKERSDFWTGLTKEWWHTRQWREEQYTKLEEEGKPARRVIERASRPEGGNRDIQQGLKG